MSGHRIFAVSVASVYPAYRTKAERKGRSKAELDEIICWLTGHSPESLDRELAKGTTFADFFAQAPAMNPAREAITGTICGIRVETIEDPTMKAIRQLDKLVDELAKGKPMARILRA